MCYVQVAEVNRSQRSTVIIPESGWVAFRDTLNALIDGEFVSGGAGAEVPDKPRSSGIDGGAARGARLGVAAADGSEPTGDGTQLWVENLPFDLTEGEVADIFASVGSVEGVKMPMQTPRRSKGVAMVRMATAAQAAEAVASLNNTTVRERPMRVRYDRYAR